MNRNTWKQSEREWAELLGGERVPVTGRQRGHAPDVDHPRLGIELKKVGYDKPNPYLSAGLKKAIDQAQKAAEHAFKRDGLARAPFVGLEWTNDNRRLERWVVMPLNDFLELTSLEDR